MSTPHLLYVNSRVRPESGTDEELWRKWYTQEHVPDLVNSGTAVCGALYLETDDFPLASKEIPPTKFLALYQTTVEESLKTREYIDDVRHDSELWPHKKKNGENGEFNARNYNLVEKLGSETQLGPDFGEETAPLAILTVEVELHDGADFLTGYREEHQGVLEKLPSYKRTLVYALGPPTPMTLGTPGKYLFIHEFGGLRGLQSIDAANATPWTTDEVRILMTRGWELIFSQGYVRNT